MCQSPKPGANPVIIFGIKGHKKIEAKRYRKGDNRDYMI